MTPVFMTSFFGSRDGDNSCNFLMDSQNITLGFEKYTGASYLTGSADTFCLKVLLSILAHSLFELDPVLTPVFMTFFFGSLRCFCCIHLASTDVFLLPLLLPHPHSKFQALNLNPNPNQNPTLYPYFTPLS